LQPSPGWQDGLTTSQFGVLEALLHLGNLTSRELSAKILKTKGNMTMVIDNLEKKGYVERLFCPEDRRKQFIRLTEYGREVITEVFPRRAVEIDNRMSALTEIELQQLGSLCKKMGLANPEESK